jgi:hypothetical protein
LSLFFWGRFLWLRRTLLSGEWPLWDPYIGGGQSAVADALHQMFLLPVLAIRVIGPEVLSFNLWVLLPFPVAAAGAWLFLARRFSASAAALGAIAFAVSGPVVSTGNFPNMSWSVAAMPWVLWSTDAAIHQPAGIRAGVMAVAVAFQALAGEPVTFFMTSVLAAAWTATGVTLGGDRVKAVWCSSTGFVLGIALSAIQLVPMVEAATLAERSQNILKDAWSLHPLALLETVAFQLSGNYYSTQSLSDAPWVVVVNVGREPFFFSLYYGVPLLALSLVGLLATAHERWGTFWAAAGAFSILLALGVHTPVYPFLRDHLPLLGSFRFPVKYLVGLSMAVAVGAAAGIDAVASTSKGEQLRVGARARFYGVGFAALVSVLAATCALGAWGYPDRSAARAAAVAAAVIGTAPDNAGASMVAALQGLLTTVVPVSAISAVLLFVATSSHRLRRAAAVVLASLIVGDVVLRASPINPVLSADYLQEPAWIARTRIDPHARFYIGGKRDGTLDSWDLDASLGYFNPPGLSGSSSRAALSAMTAFYPSAWHGREMLSYDLAVLWPRAYQTAVARFFESDRIGRDHFLDRTGVRYRVLPARSAGNRSAIVRMPYFSESWLYDWGEVVQPRAVVVSRAEVVADPVQQIEALFRGGWDARHSVVLERTPTESRGANGQTLPADSIATISSERSNQVVVDAEVAIAGSYLVLSDSYSRDWRVSVDGRDAPLLRANGLFRAVPVPIGKHTVVFTYLPQSFLWSAAVSAIAGVAVMALSATRRNTAS